MISGTSVEEERWFEGLEGWNQVFRVRYGSRQQETRVNFKPGTRVWRGGIGMGGDHKLGDKLLMETWS